MNLINITFELKYKYPHDVDRICEINSCLHIFDTDLKQIYSYDEDGVLIDVLNVSKYGDLLLNRNDGTLLSMNDTIYLFFHNIKKVAIL